MTSSKFVMAIAICFLTLHSTAQVKFVNEFLNIGVGARAHGMSGSVVATIDDGTAGYWNTAGLTQIETPLEVNAMHANWFGGIANYDYLSITKKLKGERAAAAGISVIRMGIDNIPNTLNLIGPDGTVNVDRVTVFSATDLAVLLSYAQALNKKGNLAQWRGKRFSYGISARDITTTWNTWTFNLTDEEKDVFRDTGNEVPLSSTESTLPRLIFGAAFHTKEDKISYLAEANLNVSTNGTRAGVFSGRNLSIDPSIGVEIGYAERVYVRAGIGNIQSVLNPDIEGNRSLEFQPNVGLGLSLGLIKIDYALTNIGSVSGVLVSHIFSVKLGFKAKERGPSNPTIE